MKLEKLIRDKLPEIAAAKGETLNVRTATPEEMPKLLAAKLVEEALELQEAIESGNTRAAVEEFGDMFQVVAEFMYAPMMEGFQPVMGQKTNEKGAFNSRLVLRLDPPIPKVLPCPNCGHHHVDKGYWATTRIHRSHLCEHCGHVWKPFEFATVGIAPEKAAQTAYSSHVREDEDE